MAQTYHQLQHDERCPVHGLRDQHISHSVIADQLQRDKSTINRELWRNPGPSGYDHQPAQR